MLGKRIALNTFSFCNTKTLISTVEIFGEYETMVMFEDGEELESFTSSTEEEARATHKETVERWNKRLAGDSLNKCLGIPNTIA